MTTAPSGDGARPGGPSNLQLRIVSAIVLIVAVLALTWAGGILYRIFSAAIAGAVLYEWLAMTLPAEHKGHRALVALLLAALLVLLVACV